MDNNIKEEYINGTASNVSIIDLSTNDPNIVSDVELKVEALEIKLPFQKYSQYFKALKLLEDNWTYQKYEVKCKLCISSKSLTFDSRSSSNIIKHLRKKHSSVLKEIGNKDGTLKRKCDASESNTKKSSNPCKNTVNINGQLLDDFTVKNGIVTNQESLNSLITNFIISASLPFTIIENDHFKEIINLGFPDLKLLTHSILIEKIKKLTENLLNILKERISTIEHITTTVNCWSINKKSYIGITGHWINPSDLSRVSCLLAIKRIKGKHMYNIVASQIVSTYDFFHIIEKINYSTTDNGFNFAKSFRTFCLDKHFENKTQDSDNLDLIDSDDRPVSDDEMNGVDSFTNEESAIQISISDILHEDEYSINVDPLYVLPKHQRCAAHTLKLVVSIDISNALDDPVYNEQSRITFNKCNALWSKQNESTTAADAVKNAIGVIKIPNFNKWNSTLDSVQWILSYIRTNITKINALCESQNLFRFSKNDVIFLEEFCKTMQPITIALDIIQGEKNLFLGYLLPTITQLQFKYDELFNSSMSYCRHLAMSINLGIAKRFKNQLTDPFLIVSSVSHPLFKTAWIQNNEMKSEALTLFRNIAIQVHELSSKMLLPTLSSSEVDNSNGSDDKETNFFPWSINSQQNKSVEKELNVFLNESPEKDLSVLNNFPTIKKIFLKYNTPLPCSSPIEKQFNIGGALFSKRRSHISDKYFEKVMLLKLNKLFL